MIQVADVTAIIFRILPEPHAGLLAGMVFGVKSGLTQELRNAMQTTGTLHIIALSGMNITILTQLFFSTFLLVLPRVPASILTIGVIGFFVWFVGSSPSIVRAAIMGSITLLTGITGYASVAIVTWGIACIGMIIVHPSWVSDISFQLSAFATLGMILFGPRPSLQQPPQSFLQTAITLMKKELATTLSAQVFTIPIILMAFGQLSLISPVTNLLIGWTVPVITVLGLCMCVFGLFIPAFSYVLGWVAWVFLTYMIQVILVTSRVPFANIR